MIFPRLLLILFFVLTAMTSMAQSLTRSDFWQVGDQFQLFPADTDGLSPGPAGSGQTWDFSSITYNGDPIRVLDFLAPQDAPENNLFPDATIAQQDRNNDEIVGYSFYKLDESGLVFLGISSQVTVVYSDVIDIMDFPFGVGDKKVDSFAASFSSNGATVNRSGTSTTEHDASGTLILPSGTYTNITRYKNVQEITDVVSGFNVLTTTTAYSWMKEGEREPILLYSIVVNTVAGIETTSTLIHFRDLNGNGGGQQPSEEKWISHVTNPAGGFETSFIFKNTESTDQTISITAMNTSGGTAASTEFSVPANGHSILTQSQVTGGTDATHFKAEGIEGVVVTAGYRSKNNGATAHVHQETTPRNTFYIYPGEWDYVFDGMAVVNTGDTSASITASQINAAGQPVNAAVISASLAPGGKTVAIFDDLFNAEENSLIRIDSSQPVTALFLRGTRLGIEPGFLYTNPAKADQAGQDRWIAHVTALGGGFKTRLYMHNQSEETQQVVLHPYQLNGSALSQVTVSLAALEMKTIDQGDLFGSDAVSHFSIEADDQVSISAGYQVDTGDGASAHFHESQAGAQVFWVYPGEPELVWDGLAIVNIGSSAAQITASLVNGNGSTAESASVASNLAVNGKALAIFGTLFSDMDGKAIKIESDQPCVVLFLRGTQGGISPAYLYVNPPFTP